MALTEADIARFWSKVDRAGECWMWIPEPSSRYGRFRVAGKLRRAHIISYEMQYGLVPIGLVVDHAECDTPRCVRPTHLKAVTQKVNVTRSPKAVWKKNAAKSRCPQGHEYDTANTSVYKGTRRCRKCRQAWKEAWRRERRRRGLKCI